MVILGALAVFVAVIALAWFLLLRRLDEGNYEVGRRLHPPWTRGKAVSLGPEAEDEERLVREWSAERQLEREEHAGTSNELDHSKDRNAARTWGG
jgi:hypothetical protein